MRDWLLSRGDGVPAHAVDATVRARGASRTPSTHTQKEQHSRPRGPGRLWWLGGSKQSKRKPRDRSEFAKREIVDPVHADLFRPLRNLSMLIAAMHPSAAATTTCLKGVFRMSPMANTPGTLVSISSFTATPPSSCSSTAFSERKSVIGFEPAT